MTSILTLVGVKQAKKGEKFVYMGHAGPCEKCEFYKVCISNLKPKRVYEIIDVRDIKHPCKIHEEGVRVVEVKYSNIPAALEAKQVIPGVTITYSPINCNVYDCRFIDFCRPDGLFEGDKCTIEEVMEKIEECRTGKVLRLVLLKIVS